MLLLGIADLLGLKFIQFKINATELSSNSEISMVGDSIYVNYKANAEKVGSIDIIPVAIQYTCFRAFERFQFKAL
ncbi:MAG: hypothetical protein GY928_39385 [Colwellia sp.]|nr:hypothetical protein [Colwellia sp.]